MTEFDRVLFAGLAAGALLLTGCGGGGGGGGGGLAFIPPAAVGATPAPGAPAPSPASVGKATISGTATFDFVPNESGPLNYGAIRRKPIRGAGVELLDANRAVLASGTTGPEGSFTIELATGNADVRLRVRAALVQTGAAPTWNVTVRDNTQQDGIYALETGSFDASSGALTRDVHAPSGWNGSSYGSARAAAPFAILDSVYTAQAKVLSVASSAVFPLLKVFWSINNRPASGSVASGEIGTSSFTANSAGDRAIYVLGKADVDTDEYDESVIAHEWGHYYQSAFSRDDSPGGPHRRSDRLDRRVAFSEGWGNAWSGIALARSNYTDAVGPGQSSGGSNDLSQGATSNKGWFSEASVQYVLWSLNKIEGFAPIHQAMTGDLRTSPAVTSVHPFNAGLKAAAPSSANSFAPLLTSEGIDAAADQFGSSESNNGGLALALPMYRVLTPGTSLPNVCVSNSVGPSPRDNKLGNYSYVRFAVGAAANYTISLSGGPAASDPNFRIYAARGQVASAQGNAPGSESASVRLTPGDYVLAVNDDNSSGSSTCFTASVN